MTKVPFFCARGGAGAGCCGAREVVPGLAWACSGRGHLPRIWLVLPPSGRSRSGQASAFLRPPSRHSAFCAGGACCRLWAGPACSGIEVEGVPGSTATALVAYFSWCRAGAPLPSRGLLRRPEVTQSLDLEARLGVWLRVKSLHRPLVGAGDARRLLVSFPLLGRRRAVQSTKIPRVQCLRANAHDLVLLDRATTASCTSLPPWRRHLGDLWVVTNGSCG